jgi:3-hydroxy-5-phosphonooxypentane-2,4-dione thiolase
MDWGMENRIKAIIRPETGRALMLAVDHGYFLGPTSGLDDFSNNIGPLLPYADTLMLNRGALRYCVDPGTRTPIVLRASGGTSVLTELSNEGITISIEEAIRLNAVGVAVSIFVGAEYERQTLLGISDLINVAEDYGIPVIAVTAVGKEMGRDARYLSLASRIAAELGARIVKTYFCEDFQKVVNTCPVPVVIAGGKKLPEKEALDMAYQAVSDGAVGVDMGRNIFQSEAPVAMIKAVRAVIHENMKPDKAYQMFLDEKKCTGGKKKAAKKK